MPDGGAAGAAAVADLGEIRHIPGPDVLGHGDLVGRLHREGGQPVDLRGRDPGISQGGHYGFDRQLPFRTVDLLGEFGLAYPDDRCRVLQRVRDVGHPTEPTWDPGWRQEAEKTTGKESGERKAMPSMCG